MESSPARLSETHLAELRASGLSDFTIEQAGLYSESSQVEVASILNWTRVPRLGDCLIFPFRNIDGELNGYKRAKPTTPISAGRKYESPLGKPSRLYFPLETTQILDDPTTPIGFTEGEKKALSSSQAGFPCIGVSGIWNWHHKLKKDKNGRKFGERVLHDDLQKFNWKDRIVWICFDSDTKRNSHVAHARAELARVLTSVGAKVVLIDLPLGPRDADGLPGKMAIDDFIVAHGEEEFKTLVNQAISGSKKVTTLEDLRARMKSDRIQSIGSGDVYLDTSPTGSGKSTAEIWACAKAKRSLTVLPTHKLCEETAELYRSKGLNAAAFPQLSEENCQNHSKAKIALKCGLPVSHVVCPTCQFKDDCSYHELSDVAKNSDHRIGTHKRAEFTFPSLSEGVKYVAIHEDAISIFRPMASCRKRQAFLDIGHAFSEIKKELIRVPQFILAAIDVAGLLANCLGSADQTTMVEPRMVAEQNKDDLQRLFRIVSELEGDFDPDAMRIVIATATGKADSIVTVMKQFDKETETEKIKRSVVAVWKTNLPRKTTIWISDATADASEIEAVLGVSVIQFGPEGELRQHHKTRQIIGDVTKGTKPNKVADTLGAVIDSLPFEKFGVITHRKFLQPEKKGILGKNISESRWKRISKTDNFRGTESRGSNAWTTDCDCLIVLGTPRVPPEAIMHRLIRTGNVSAACRDGGWLGPGSKGNKSDYWSAVQPDGSRVSVRSTGYTDRDWHNAYRQLVTAEILQSAGRARTVCKEKGIPCYVLTKEPMGFELATFGFGLSKSEQRILDELKKLTALSLLIYYRDSAVSSADFGVSVHRDSAVSSVAISEAAGIQDRQARKLLSGLASKGIIQRIGSRSGWLPSTKDIEKIIENNASSSVSQI